MKAAALALLMALGYTAAPERFVIEDGTAGFYMQADKPLLIGGQSGATLKDPACVAGSCTRAVPTDEWEGMALNWATGWRLWVCAAAGETLSGAGTVELYLYDSKLSAWGTNPSLTQSVTSTARCQTWEFVPAASGNVGYRVVARPVAVTVSGGAHLTIELSAVCTVKGAC